MRSLFFIMGQDALSDLPNWHDPDAHRATRHTGRRRPRRRRTLSQLPSTIGAKVHRLAMPTIAISGSDIRERVATGRSIRYLVPPAVERYIREKRLYRD